MIERVPIFHFTHIENLARIVESVQILCKSQLAKAGATYADIALGDVQRRRARTRVPCGAGGVLHDYVPFFFAPRSPMLYYISRNVHIYPEGQGPLVYLVSSIQAIQEAELPFAFTDGMPIMMLSNFYDDTADLNRVDWNLMRSTWWNDTPEYPDRQRRREAEFLVHQSCPWELVEEIVVRTEQIRDRVQDILGAADHQPLISIRSGWYY